MATLLTAATAAFLVAITPVPTQPGRSYEPLLPPAAVMGLDIAEAACLMYGAGQRLDTIKRVALGMIPELADKRGIEFNQENKRVFSLALQTGIRQLCPESGLVDR